MLKFFPLLRGNFKAKIFLNNYYIFSKSNENFNKFNLNESENNDFNAKKNALEKKVTPSKKKKIY